MVSALLESQVVLGADVGKHGDFLATQSLDASAVAVRQADVGGLEQSRRARRKAASLRVVSIDQGSAPHLGKGGPGITSNAMVWISGVCGWIVVASTVLHERDRHAYATTD